jgi:hypothetical protein
MIAAPACAPSACRAHTRDTCRPMYAVVRTAGEQVLWREHAALAQKLSKKISTRHGAADKRRACAIAGGMVAVADYNDQRAVLAGLHAHPWEVHLRSLV